MPLRLETRLPYVANQPTKARRLFDAICKHPAQRRQRIEWSDLLAQVATAHCIDMAERGFFGHTNPDGVGANERIRRAGIHLPAMYDGSPTANYTESLAAGDPTVDGTLRAWLNSPGHRPHVFGEADFFGTQTLAAVGYCEGGYYKRYWCFLACHRGD